MKNFLFSFSSIYLKKKIIHKSFRQVFNKNIFINFTKNNSKIFNKKFSTLKNNNNNFEDEKLVSNKKKLNISYKHI